MKKRTKSIDTNDPAKRQAVIYARVSSKEQQKEGYSIPAQLSFLRSTPHENGYPLFRNMLMWKLPSKRAAITSVRWLLF